MVVKYENHFSLLGEAARRRRQRASRAEGGGLGQHKQLMFIVQIKCCRSGRGGQELGILLHIPTPNIYVYVPALGLPKFLTFTLL